ncbi:leucine-rich repeat-containing protein 72 [Aplysia californica]|uniref:Leucine-rich repeat-containing protein 72 n=1 Tax=Aplysia californica TaxID=6500 RepID=A0ABM0JLU8_APLCA|nr:leucine-rich repeat-containing protein 72 [Aplysia californica]
MASSEEAIEQALQRRGVKRDKDVEELYLSNRNLVEMIDLKRFRYLKKLWANGNKLRRANFLSVNFRLSELHLHDNQLSDISGCLRQLTCLTTLTLHNNQLTKLDKVMKEFDRMNALSCLNLFNNPIAQEPEYRLFVINSVPSLTLLDRSEVTKSERDISRRIYRQSEEKVKDRVAFGRKSQGPPNLYFPSTPRKSFALRPDTAEIANNYLKNNPSFSNPEEAVNTRRLKKSLTMYSSFDWGKVPRIEDRRRSAVQFGSPRIITQVYR